MNEQQIEAYLQETLLMLAGDAGHADAIDGKPMSYKGAEGEELATYQKAYRSTAAARNLIGA